MRRSKINLKTATLDELEIECAELVGTQFGHNMIGIICGVVEDRFGKEDAERLFDLYQGQEDKWTANVADAKNQKTHLMMGCVFCAGKS